MKNTTVPLLVLIVAMAAILFVSITNKSQQTPPLKNTPTTSYILSDVSAHNSASSCWMVVNKNVYDVTTFINSHPGGSTILQGCGIDATSLFDSISKHRGQATSVLSQYLIGILQS